jgi:hypothetical protein
LVDRGIETGERIELPTAVVDAELDRKRQPRRRGKAVGGQAQGLGSPDPVVQAPIA